MEGEKRKRSLRHRRLDDTDLQWMHSMQWSRLWKLLDVVMNDGMHGKHGAGGGVMLYLETFLDADYRS